MRKALIGLIALAISVPAFAQEEPLYPERSDVRRIMGQCEPGSRKAAGNLTDDISQPEFHRAYRCNLLQMQKLKGDRIIFAFSTYGSESGIVGFEGYRIDRDIYYIDAIHYGLARLNADKGLCRLDFDKAGVLERVTCGGHAIRDGSRYAPTVGFVVR